MSIIMKIANDVKKKQRELTAYNSSENILLFGTGKSSIIASLSDFTDKPVLALTPAGGSTHLTSEYDNFISYPVNDLDELEALIKDLEKSMDRIRKVKIAIDSNNKPFIEKIKEVLVKENNGDVKAGEEEFLSLKEFADNGTFPVGAIGIEEADIISSWVQDRVEQDLKVENLGDDKKSLGSDWNIFKREIVGFWTRVLKLPVKVIMATSEVLPTESQSVKKVKPNICTGSGARLIESLIGNIYYVSENNGEFKCRFLPDNKTFAKQKFRKVKSNTKILDEIDITGRPEYMWEYINEIKNEVLPTKSDTATKAEEQKPNVKTKRSAETDANSKK